MTTIKKGTKLYNAIMWDYMNLNKGDIFEAYNRPSPAKIRSYKDIENRALNTAGYNYDLKVVACSSHFYSTIYSYIENGKKYIVKDTYANTYVIEA